MVDVNGEGEVSEPEVRSRIWVNCLVRFLGKTVLRLELGTGYNLRAREQLTFTVTVRHVQHTQ